MTIAPLTDLWAVMYVCQLSRLKFSAPVMPMYFYCIYTNIYSISYMMSSWSPHQLHYNLVQLPMHSMDVCTLIILVKFQNFCTRTSPCTVAPHGSSWKSWQDTSRHHWDFTAWPLDQSWLGIKAATTGQNLHLVFKFSSFDYMVSKFIHLQASKFLSLFSPLLPFYSSLTLFSQFF